MMNDFLRLQRLLNPAALVDTDSDLPPKLTESTPQVSYSVELKNLPSDTLIIKADDFLPDKIIDCQSNKGFCKRADYIIVNEHEIIFIELKYGKAIEKKHIKKQLMGAQCLMDYLIGIGKRFYNHSKFLETTSTNQYFVVIAGFSLNKRTTKKQDSASVVNDSPDRMLILKIGNANVLNYNRLLVKV